MRFLTILQSVFTFPVAFMKWTFTKVISPVADEQQLPPIRYDGDPTEIYLA